MRMSEFKPIETQEELDHIIKERIRREREKFSDYEELKTRVSELETENNGLKTTIGDFNQSKEDTEKMIADLQAQVTGFEASALRTRIALQNGLPFDFADRLQGTDEESLNADAERLAGFIKASAPVAPMKNLEPEVGDTKYLQMKQMLQGLIN